MDYDSLPSSADDPAWGISADEVSIVAAVLSHAIATHEPGSFVNNLCWMTALVGTTEVFDEEAGAMSPGATPLLDPTQPWPAGARAWKSLGLKRKQELGEVYFRGVAQNGPGWHYPLAVLARFVPPVLWPIVAAALREGPRLSSRRLAGAMEVDRNRVLPARRDLPERRPSKECRSHNQDAFRTLYRSAKHLRDCGLHQPLVADWDRVPPPTPIFDGVSANGNREGVPWPLVRMAWARIQRRIDELLQRLPEESEVDALDRLPDDIILSDSAFETLRDRAVFFMVAVFGARPCGVALLRRDDYVPDYLYGGRRLPVVRFRGHKGVSEDERADKVLPSREAAAPIEVLWAFLDRYYGLRPGVLAAARQKYPDAAMALIPAERARPYCAYSAQSLARKFAGSRPSGMRNGKTSTSTTPFIPLDPAASALECYDGFQAGQFRHATMKAIRDFGSEYLRGVSENWDPKVMAEALVDHKRLQGDQFGYYDENNVRGRRRLSSHALVVTYNALTSDFGARKAPDVERFQDLLDRRDVLRAEADYVRKQIADVKRRRREGEEAESLLFELVASLGDREDLRDALTRVEVHLERLRNPRNFVPIPDDAPVGSEFVDLGAVESEWLLSEGEPSDDQVTKELPFRRRWLSVVEFAEVLVGLASQASVKRWIQGRLRYSDSDTRNAWPADRVPVSGEGRRRAIWIDGISQRFLDGLPEANRRLAAEKLMFEGPASWSARECGARTPPEFIELGARRLI